MNMYKMSHSERKVVYLFANTPFPGPSIWWTRKPAQQLLVLDTDVTSSRMLWVCMEIR